MEYRGKTLPDSKLIISFDAATILKMLNSLNIGKSPAPDLVNAKILKELAKPVALVLTIQRHAKLAVYRKNERKQILVLFTKNEANMIRKTIALLA